MCMFNSQDLKQAVQVISAGNGSCCRIGFSKPAHIKAKNPVISGKRLPLLFPHATVNKPGMDEHKNLALSLDFIVKLSVPRVCVPGGHFLLSPV